MTLIRVDDDLENAWVTNEFTTRLVFAFQPRVFLGGTDQAVEGEWRWADDTLFWDGAPAGGLYTHWEAGRPRVGGNSDCLGLQPDGFWTDRACNSGGVAFGCESRDSAGNPLGLRPRRASVAPSRSHTRLDSPQGVALVGALDVGGRIAPTRLERVLKNADDVCFHRGAVLERSAEAHRDGVAATPRHPPGWWRASRLEDTSCKLRQPSWRGWLHVTYAPEWPPSSRAAPP